jgi:hypothetical protein
MLFREIQQSIMPRFIGLSRQVSAFKAHKRTRSVGRISLIISAFILMICEVLLTADGGSVSLYETSIVLALIAFTNSRKAASWCFGFFQCVS